MAKPKNIINIFRSGVFIYVDSPFQLLQVVEYSHKISIKNPKIIIRLNDNKENNKQLTNLVKKFDIPVHKVYKIQANYISLAKYFSILLSVLACNEAIFGDSNSFSFRLYRRFFSSSKILLLDDGVATLNCKGSDRKYNRFTIFDGVVENYFKNEFSHLSELITTKVCETAHVIVGAKLIEESIIDSDYYYELLSKIINNLKVNEERVIYVPHRGESDESLKKINEKFDLDVVKLDYPIELIGLECNIYPVSVSAVISTALFSMRLIYPKASIFISPMSSLKLQSRKTDIINLYRSYEERKIGTFI